MENSFYVYIYLDPRKPGEYFYDDLKFDFEPFYVGKGKGDRIIEGLTDLRSHSSYKINKMKKIRESGKEIIYMKLFENLLENMAFELEKETIKKIGRKKENGPLTNIQEGGTGGYNHSKRFTKEEIVERWRETRNKTIEYNKFNGIKLKRPDNFGEKISNIHKMRRELGLKNKPRTKESKLKLSAALKGIPKSEEHKEKLKIANLGKKRSEDSRLKQSKTCKETLSKIKSKLVEKSSGLKNGNSKKYIIKINETNEIKELYGYKTILDFYNKLTNSSYKDYYFIISKLKQNLIKEISLIEIIRINVKNKGTK